MRKLVLVSLSLLLFACAAATPAETGWLAGRVTIGPLQPVMQVGVPEPTPAPEVFAARWVVVLDAQGEEQVAIALLGPDGRYEIELPAGRYVVDINHAGIDSAAGLPVEIEILPGETTTLDIDIDTGIR
ncbi:MAG: carboxypeptidase regulatory-like domain-containing protein [Anaerolineae bacterium]|nr:MAG: carboxypeptidase regulatory-like domain-containing protein [Anaerolineae bacterium]